MPYWPEFSYKLRITLAGFPTATAPAGMSLTTTDPAPTTASSPMVTPGQTITPPPSQTLLPIVMGLPPSKPLLRVGGSNGWMGGQQLHVRADLAAITDDDVGYIQRD